MQPSEIFMISPAVGGLWEVTHFHRSKKVAFLTKEDAERYAREQARLVHPSEVRLLDEAGRLVYREIYGGAS